LAHYPLSNVVKTVKKKQKKGLQTLPFNLAHYPLSNFFFLLLTPEELQACSDDDVARSLVRA
jgi:uncharacterized protein YdaL